MFVCVFVCVHCSPKEKESASPAGGPAASTPLCSIEESRAALPGTDQLERGGEGRGGGRREVGPGAGGHLIMTSVERLIV